MVNKVTYDFQKRKGGTRIKHRAAAALLSLLLLVCLPGSSAGAAVRGTDSPTPRLLLSAARRIRPLTPAVAGGASGATAATTAATDLLLCLESAPRRFALLLRLEVPDGWRLDVSAGEIPLASRRLSDSSLLLLLDGQTSSASPVLARLTVTRPPGASGCVRVLPNRTTHPYIIGKKPKICLTPCLPPRRRHACRHTCRRPPCGVRLSPGGSATAAPPETATPPEPPTGDAEYIGCQEATGASGDLCVRFPVPRAGGWGCLRRGLDCRYAPVGSAPGRGVWRFRGCPRCAPGRAGFMRQGLAVSCWHIRIPGCPPRGLSLPCVTAPGFCAPPCTGTERLRGIVTDGAGFLGRLSPAALAIPAAVENSMGAFPPAALAIPAAVENSMAAFPPGGTGSPCGEDHLKRRRRLRRIVPSPRSPLSLAAGTVHQCRVPTATPPVGTVNARRAGNAGGKPPAGYHSGRFCKCRRRFNAGVPGAEPPAK